MLHEHTDPCPVCTSWPERFRREMHAAGKLKKCQYPDCEEPLAIRQRLWCRLHHGGHAKRGSGFERRRRKVRT